MKTTDFARVKSVALPKKILKLALILCVVILCAALLYACNRYKLYFVLGTDLEINTEGTGGSDLTERIYEYIASLENVLSPSIPGSDLYRINNAAENEPVVCRDATMSVMRSAELAFLLSGGAYDPSVYPLVKLWGFDSEAFGKNGQGAEVSPPSDEEIAAVKRLVGLKDAFEINYENKTITKNIGYGGAMLDFGGVAKGYAVREALRLVGANQRALINLGGNIGVTGRSYTIGIGNPRPADELFGKLTLNAGECVSTSGDYERYYTLVCDDPETGEKTSYKYRMHHIIDPRTGKPSGSLSGQSGEETLISVSVIAADGALGDALSTAVLVLGKTKGSELLNSDEVREFGVKAILINASLDYQTAGGLGFSKS